MLVAKMGVCHNILGLVGKTPMIRLNRVVSNIPAVVMAKLECFNPSGSTKDRIVLSMVLDAERRGLIHPGNTLVEATSGNTGIALAMVGAAKGYNVVIVAHDKISDEKRRIIEAYGAKVIIKPRGVPLSSPEHYYTFAKMLAEKTPGAVMLDQFKNPANPLAHYRTTAREILEQVGRSIDVFVAGIGTGGTITGVAKALKEENPRTRVVGVEPEGSTISGGVPHSYEIEGIGDGREIPLDVLDLGLVDEIVKVSDREAFLMARRLAREEGLLVGGSSGAAVAALQKIGVEKDSVVVVLFPDSGDRYLTKIFSDEWMTEHRYL